jgi:pimeloyl-ACP methyl ester carboxylesterase
MQHSRCETSITPIAGAPLIVRRVAAQLIQAAGDQGKHMTQTIYTGTAGADLLDASGEGAKDSAVFRSVGAGDTVTPPANCRRIYDAVAASSPSLCRRFETIPEAGHAVPQERPQAVADLVAAFAPPASEA